MNLKRLIPIVFLALPYTGRSQGAMIVEDPGMMLQQGVEHAESFGEMMTQTSVFLEDLNLKYEEWSENVKYYAKMAKLASTAGRKIMVLYKEIDNVYTRLEYFRKNLRKNEYLSPSEKLVLYSEGVAACRILMENKDEIIKQANQHADISGKGDGYKQLEQIDRMIFIVRSVDRQLLTCINHANSLIAAKRKFIEKTKAVNRMLTIKY